MTVLRVLVLGAAMVFVAASEVQGQGGDKPLSSADRKVQARIQGIFGQVQRFKDVELRIQEGVVHLRGSVATAESRHEAEQIAKDSGAAFVNNELRVAIRAQAEQSPRDLEIQERLRAVFARIPSLSELRVRVQSGVVSLEGQAGPEDVRKRALDLARGLPNVVFIDNQIREPQGVKKKLAPSLQKLQDLGTRTWAQLPIFGIGLVIVLIFWLISKLVGRFRFGLAKNKLLRSLVQQVAELAVLAVGVFIALDLLEATALVGAFLGTAGVIGLALGFAFRDIVENYLMSLLLSLRQPFDVDDFVEINGQQGTILSLTTSETVLMTPDGNHLRFPNSLVFKSTLINYTRNPLRRLDFTVGVGLYEDLSRVQSEGLGVLRDMPGVIDDPAPTSFVKELGDFSVSVQFFGWVDQEKNSFAKVKSQAMRLVKERFDQMSIEMPLPSQTLQVLRLDAAEVKAAIEDKLKLLPTAKGGEIDVSVVEDLKGQLERERAANDAQNLLAES